MAQHPQTPHPAPPIPRGTQKTPKGAGTPPKPVKTPTPSTRPRPQTLEHPQFTFSSASHGLSTPNPSLRPQKEPQGPGPPVPSPSRCPKRLRDPPNLGALRAGESRPHPRDELAQVSACPPHPTPAPGGPRGPGQEPQGGFGVKSEEGGIPQFPPCLSFPPRAAPAAPVFGRFGIMGGFSSLPGTLWAPRDP